MFVNALSLVFMGFFKIVKLSFSDRTGSFGIIGFPMKLSDFPFVFHFGGTQMRPRHYREIIEFRYISPLQSYQKIIGYLSDCPFISILDGSEFGYEIVGNFSIFDQHYRILI